MYHLTVITHPKTLLPMGTLHVQGHKHQTFKSSLLGIKLTIIIAHYCKIKNQFVYVTV